MEGGGDSNPGSAKNRQGSGQTEKKSAMIVKKRIKDRKRGKGRKKGKVKEEKGENQRKKALSF